MLDSNANPGLYIGKEDAAHITCAAFAKINLTLDIIGKRADGYHLLQMVMQSVPFVIPFRLKRGKTEAYSFSVTTRTFRVMRGIPS